MRFEGSPMSRRLDFKLIFSLTILIVAISCISGYLNFRMQKDRLVEAMILGADQLSRSITSATWHAMLDDDRKAAYEMMRVIADKQGVDRIRMFNREGRLVFSTDAQEQPSLDQSFQRRLYELPWCDAGPDQAGQSISRVRYATSPDGIKTLNIVTPIHNEPSCSNASCHAHLATTKVLGVLDVALRLDPVQQQTRAATVQTILSTVVAVIIGAAFVILFTRRFVATPIREVIQGTKALSAMQLDRPIQIRRRSQELDELVDSINRMRERLKIAVDDLNEMQQTLESKVVERTEQLRAAHRKLLQADRLASLGQLAASVAHEINNPISGRAQSFQPARTPDGQRRISSRAGSRIPQVSQPNLRGNHSRGADCYGPTGVFPPVQAPARSRRFEQTRTQYLASGRPQTEAYERGNGSGVGGNLASRGVRPFANPAGDSQSDFERSPGDAAQRRRQIDHPHSPSSRRGLTWSFACAIRVKASLPKTSRRYSTRSSPPRRKERESGLGLAVLYGIVKGSRWRSRSGEPAERGRFFFGHAPAQSQERCHRREGSPGPGGVTGGSVR